MNKAQVRLLLSVLVPLFAWLFYWWAGLSRDTTAHPSRMEYSVVFSLLIISVLLCVFALWLAWDSMRLSQYRAVSAIAGVGSAVYLMWAIPLLYVGLPNFWRYLNIHG